jgi:predicted nucleic acid-binding protein
LIDTDVLSATFKQQPHAVARVGQYLRQHGRLVLSALTRYEYVRGLKHRSAHAQLARFDAFCRQSTIVGITDAILERAGDLWSIGRRRGLPVGDVDLMIAATSLEHKLELATANTAHFEWIPGIVVVDWTKP